jgi:glutamate transport system substrate-binding protein
VIGKPFSALEYGVGFKHDDVAFCKKVTAALQEFIDSGEWQKAVDKNFGPAGFKPGADNPPTLASCSNLGG